MKLKLFLPVITLTVASIGLIQAQNTAEDKVPKYTLKEAQTYALDHNQSLKNKKLEKRKAEEEVTQTLSQGLPQVSGEIRGRHNFDVRTNVITFGLPGQEPQKSEVRFGTNYRSQASINFSQLIFDGSFFLGLKASKVYVNLSKKEFEQSQRDTRAKVAKAYYSCLVTARNYQILKKNVQQVEQTLFETRQRYKNGLVEQLDVDRQQLTLQTLENQLSKVKREKKVARKLLKFQMGYPVKDSIRLSGKLETEF
jgi:outer membrane protein